MANATRTVRVKFTGTAQSLIRAARAGGAAMKRFQSQAKQSIVGVSGLADGLADGIIGALGTLPTVAKGAAVVAAAGIGVTMAPVVASAIISGVLLAVGGGVLAAGIIGAAKSPKVTAAWKRFGRQATVVFERFSKPFVAPMVRAATTFGRALARMGPTIDRIGATLAPVIDKLAPAFAGMAEKALPGILAAAQASVPLFEILADNLPGIGGAIAQFFQAIAAGGPAAQVFFSGFLGWVQDILPRIGGVVTWVAGLGTKIDEFKDKLAPVREALKTVGDFISTGMADARKALTDWLEKNRENLKKFIDQMAGFIADTGPAFRLTILGIAFSFSMLVSNVMLLVDWLDRLKRWYYNNREWLLSLSGPLMFFVSKEKGIPGIGARAEGGPVRPWNDYLVGEEGPEILRMGSTGGTVIPNDKISSGASSSSTTTIVEIPIYIGNEVTRVVRREISERDRGLRRGVAAMAGAR